jgi:hypothetical protein
MSMSGANSSPQYMSFVKQFIHRVSNLYAQIVQGGGCIVWVPALNASPPYNMLDRKPQLTESLFEVNMLNINLTN